MFFFMLETIAKYKKEIITSFLLHLVRPEIPMEAAIEREVKVMINKMVDEEGLLGMISSFCLVLTQCGEHTRVILPISIRLCFSNLHPEDMEKGSIYWLAKKNIKNHGNCRWIDLEMISLVTNNLNSFLVFL